MKLRNNTLLLFLLAALFAAASELAAGGSVCSVAALAQGPGRGPITVPRDPEAEKQSYKSLDAAKFYFYKRKPGKNDKEGMERSNKAVEDRLQEILDLNPNFARIDEVYFLLGEVALRRGDSEKAVEYWNKVLKETSDEKLKSDVQKRLDENKTPSKKG
ncbi:MAG: hypothetical protein JNJ50_03960 [Acidobacteria bacterium]|nr:hypothetical protein [Acidobacteriota bacterium]